MRIKFWGVRGSLACPGPRTIKYGGNTACIHIDVDQDYQLIIDCGTGIRELGNSLLANPDVPKPIKAHIFLTHTHWDHIMGLPFFKPIYIPGTELHIYGPKLAAGDNLQEIVGGQMSYEHFPVNHEDLEADIYYHELTPGMTELPGGVKISYIYINHPVETFGYKIEYQNNIVATCYDHEPYANIPEKNISAVKENRRLINFYKNADILIHDAQYTTEEYEKNFRGWGHSTFETALSNAVKAKVKSLYFFHHDTERTDEQLDRIFSEYAAKGRKQGIFIDGATELNEIIL